MATYLYCLFRDRVDPPEGLAGISGAPVRAVDAGALRLWLESVPAAPVASADALRVHDAVTSAGLTEYSTPLPVRFGSVFDSDDDCLASLAGRTPELLAALDRVAGRVEMTVGIRLPTIAPEVADQPVDSRQPSAGRAYLERLRGERQRTQILQQQGHVLSRPVVNAVGHLVIDERATLRPSPPSYLVSHLIPRSAVEEYRRLANAAIGGIAAGESPRAVVRGPSAPYSFTGEAG